MLAGAAVLTGESLRAYLTQQGISCREYERWCRALQEELPVSLTTALQRRVGRTRQLQSRERAAPPRSEEPHHGAALGRVQQPRPAQVIQSRTLPGRDEDQHSLAAANINASVRKRRRGRGTVGRVRKFNALIPAHIDQSELPKGIYWNRTGRGGWYVFVTDPVTGARNTKIVAGSQARLSVLRAIVGERPRDYDRGTVGWVMARFEESTEYSALSAGTRKNYRYCVKSATDYRRRTTEFTAAADRRSIRFM